MKKACSILFLLAILAGLNSCMKKAVAQVPLAGLWSIEKANEWGAKQPWLVGANFSPSHASNQLEMWQAETWNPELIDKELGWAEDLGFNTVRVFLHYFPFRDDKEGFFKRIDQFLEISAKHKIKPMFIFFDDVWYPNPRAGRQPDVLPHVHNSNWVQCPGAEILLNEKRHMEVRPYVVETMTRYKNDARVLLWDLYNEPQNTNNNSYGEMGKGKEQFSLSLLKKVFAWAREVDPSQPISSGVWRDDWEGEATLSEFNKFMLENSDVITYHNYSDLEYFKKITEPLKRYKRPIICTEYMARGMNSLFATHLPYMAENNIGAIMWGFVSGRSQTIYPWDSWDKKYTNEPELWFHDIFRQDGTPYRQDEVDLIKSLTKEE